MPMVLRFLPLLLVLLVSACGDGKTGSSNTPHRPPERDNVWLERRYGETKIECDKLLADGSAEACDKAISLWSALEGMYRRLAPEHKDKAQGTIRKLRKERARAYRGAERAWFRPLAKGELPRVQAYAHIMRLYDDPDDKAYAKIQEHYEIEPLQSLPRQLKEDLLFHARRYRERAKASPAPQQVHESLIQALGKLEGLLDSGTYDSRIFEYWSDVLAVYEAGPEEGKKRDRALKDLAEYELKRLPRRVEPSKDSSEPDKKPQD